MTHTDRTTFAGLAFFALAAQFMTVIMAAASIAPGYDVRGGAISDLGVINETAWLFNGSLLLTGVLNIAAILLVFPLWQRPLTLLVFVLASVGAAGAGLIHLGNPWHGVFALVAFLMFNVETLVSANWVRGPMRWIGVLLGVLGLAYVLVMFVGDSGYAAIFGPIGHGGAERMIVYPSMLWLTALGGYLMAGGNREDPAHTAQ
jgi:hypothetical membrane protein